jgi:prevent-host-death family protein
MAEVTVRELRNEGGRVIDRVLAGESLVVTRDGEPVAELRPLPHAVLDAATLLRQWRHLPTVDPAALRADIDAVLDQAL